MSYHIPVWFRRDRYNSFAVVGLIDSEDEVNSRGYYSLWTIGVDMFKGYGNSNVFLICDRMLTVIASRV